MKYLIIAATWMVVAATTAAPLKSKVSEVTVFADRALVTRTGDFELQKGVSEVALKQLPAWMDRGSIRARIIPASAGEVIHVSAKSVYLEESTDAEIRKAREALLQVSDKLKTLQDTQTALDQRLGFVKETREFTSARLPKDTQTRDIPVQYYKDMIAFVHEEIVNIQKEKRELEKQIRELRPVLAVREKALNDLTANQKLEQTELAITVKGHHGAKAKLEVSYQLPGASWEPVHEVRIEDGNKVRITSIAKVRQTTGEDWPDAVIKFSTRNPSRQTRVPQLESLLVGGKSTVNPLNLSGLPSNETWELAQSNWDNNGLFYNKKNFKGKFEGNDWGGNIREQRASTVRARRSFSKLEKRGTTALYEAEGLQAVPADGNTVRIPYAALRIDGTLRLLAAPEVSQNAARTLELTYNNDLPLLPGKAGLFIDSAYIGDTALDFVAAGETFLLFAGTADDLIVKRVKNHELSELKRGRKTNRMKVAFYITVENTSSKAQVLRLADRIPVSDDKEIKVSYVRIDPLVEPEQNGLLMWESEIPANEIRTFSLQYQVEYPTAIRTRQRAVQYSIAPNASSIQSDLQIENSVINADDVELQIMQLEATF